MNPTLLSESLAYINCTGIHIGIERLEFLKNSLIVLQKENHFKKIYYWGKINAHQNDYHIAYGHHKNCLTDRLNYYSLNCLDWLLLPKTTSTVRILTSLALNLFQGDPSIVTTINVPDEILRNQHNDKIKTLKEEDRLAATIDIINENAMVIPRGSWFKHLNGDITENPSFSGLDLNESIQLKSYLHARLPQAKWNENLMKRPDYNYCLDFLDPINTDIPKECWNLQLYVKNSSIILHNLYWPGMTFYQIINSPHYGSIYVGNGKQNFDVPFMV